MSQRLRPLTHSLRALEKGPAGPSHVPARVARVINARRCLHASSALQSAQPGFKVPSSSRGFGLNPSPSSANAAGESWSQREARPEELARLKEHLDGLFAPLSFSPELSRRILTHASHRDAVNGHNQRLSFIGRRVLESYFLLFLHSVRLPANAKPDYTALSERNVNTYVFGEHIGNAWTVGSVLRWTPPEKVEKRGRHGGVGLYKVSGTAVEALVGGVYHQYGGTVAHRLFHTRILPLLPHLPPAFAQHAAQICEKMGGRDAPLLMDATIQKPNGASPEYTVETAASKATPARDPVERVERTAGKQATFTARPSGVGVSGLSRERQPERVQREKLAL